MPLKTTVRKRPDGRYLTTLPKRFGDRHDLGGTPVSWRVESRDRLGIVLDPDQDDKTETVHRDGRGQHTVSVPTGLAAAMRLDGATVAWDDPTRTRLTVTVETRGESNE